MTLQRDYETERRAWTYLNAAWAILQHKRRLNRWNRYCGARRLQVGFQQRRVRRVWAPRDRDEPRAAPGQLTERQAEIFQQDMEVTAGVIHSIPGHSSCDGPLHELVQWRQGVQTEHVAGQQGSDVAMAQNDLIGPMQNSVGGRFASFQQPDDGLRHGRKRPNEEERRLRLRHAKNDEGEGGADPGRQPIEQIR